MPGQAIYNNTATFPHVFHQDGNSHHRLSNDVMTSFIDGLKCSGVRVYRPRKQKRRCLCVLKYIAKLLYS